MGRNVTQKVSFASRRSTPVARPALTLERVGNVDTPSGSPEGIISDRSTRAVDTESSLQQRHRTPGNSCLSVKIARRFPAVQIILFAEPLVRPDAHVADIRLLVEVIDQR